ncbi:hypothetical protein [Vibrio coralliilyticus]|uniref:hypothetical protein n=1 Tax=Vibrio coralliilyticus TaxID=190893 RepID=UPI00148CF3D0|nr:hypothetical protein [Vibrio coralliilyticus]
MKEWVNDLWRLFPNGTTNQMLLGYWTQLTMLQKNESLELTPVFKSGGNYFFGYYDKSPISADGTKHLALRVDSFDDLPDKHMAAEIGYFDLSLNSEHFHVLAQTKTFNWQQGCMLQWYGDKNTKVIYNDLIDGQFSSVVLDINTLDKTTLPLSIYTLSSDSSFALCIDNERHHWVRRAYSYDGVSNNEKNKKLVKGDGVYHLDTQSGKVKQIIDIEQLLEISPLENMQGATHYVEHLMIAPGNTRFAFFHRWKLDDGGIYARLYTANVNGSDIYLLNDSGRMSHYCWKNGYELFGWGGVPNHINKLRKHKNIVKLFIKPLLPLYKKLVKGNAIDGASKISSLVTGDSYILFEDKSKKRSKVPVELLNKDGHPSYCPVDCDWIITDTYPDAEGLAKLILFNQNSNQVIELGCLKSIKKFDNTINRCDLHPKWSYDGKKVSIDTMNDGVRSVYVYDVSEFING